MAASRDRDGRLIATVLVAFPTGSEQAKIVARYQPPALAAMEGRFESGPMADITLIGQPNVKERRLDNPIRLPGMLSFLRSALFTVTCRGWTPIRPKHGRPTSSCSTTRFM